MKILITEPKDFHPKSLSLLEKKGKVLKGPFNRQQLLESIKEVDVLILRLGHSIDKEVLDIAKALKFILTPTTGLNHIDLEQAEGKGIKVISLKGETEFLSTIPATAEHTWSLMLSLLRRIPVAHEHVLEGKWNREKFKAHDLSYYKLGILGYGRVGKKLAEYAQVFQMPFVFYDIDPAYHGHPNRIADLESFFQEIDVLSVNIPLDKNNEGFLNRSNLKFLKTDAFIVNTSRGEIIEEAYVAERLLKKKLGGLATDVLHSEMDDQARLKNPIYAVAKKLDNVVITPHIAGATYESMWRTEEFIVDKWLGAMNSEKLNSNTR